MILSGNPHPQISEEAELLDLIRYCNGRVQGHVHAENFSKQTVLEEWMAEDGFTGEHLIMFGDGAAEIKATRNLGGLSYRRVLGRSRERLRRCGSEQTRHPTSSRCRRHHR